MAGGIDKRAVAKGDKAMEEDVRNMVLPLLEEGGYIPMIDHAIPPDISFQNFLDYLAFKRKAIAGELLIRRSSMQRAGGEIDQYREEDF